ncbi:hypothetical protein J2R80_007131 [Bradyrhizobium sp. USDA 4541]|nr:hypothetical protein [Bradyrhizobium sp. USDA 4541]
MEASAPGCRALRSAGRLIFTQRHHSALETRAHASIGRPSSCAYYAYARLAVSFVGEGHYDQGLRDSRISGAWSIASRSVSHVWSVHRRDTGHAEADQALISYLKRRCVNTGTPLACRAIVLGDSERSRLGPRRGGHPRRRLGEQARPRMDALPTGGSARLLDTNRRRRGERTIQYQGKQAVAEIGITNVLDPTFIE